MESTNGSLTVGGTLTMFNSFTIPVGSSLRDSLIGAPSSQAITVNGTFEMNKNSVTFGTANAAINVAAGGTFKMTGTVPNSSLALTAVNFTSGVGAAGSTLYLATLGCPRLNSTTLVAM